jgi:hypothetical protein
MPNKMSGRPLFAVTATTLVLSSLVLLFGQPPKDVIEGNPFQLNVTCELFVDEEKDKGSGTWIGLGAMVYTIKNESASNWKLRFPLLRTESRLTDSIIFTPHKRLQGDFAEDRVVNLEGGESIECRVPFGFILSEPLDEYCKRLTQVLVFGTEGDSDPDEYVTGSITAVKGVTVHR